jgi:hypothetical protein
LVLIRNPGYRTVVALALGLSDGPAGAAQLLWSHCRGVPRNRNLTLMPLIYEIRRLFLRMHLIFNFVLASGTLLSAQDSAFRSKTGYGIATD